MSDPQRKAVEDEIERLIALLDGLGPDPDLEENGDKDADLSEDDTVAWLG